MTNEILVELIQAGENTANNMQKLWEQNRGMIWKLAQQYRNKAEIEDLMQEGFIGLCNAVDAWQPDAGASFLHYAVFWIKQGMRRYIDDCGYTVRIPVGQRERIGKYNRICQQYRAKLGRDPQDWEAARLLGVSMAVLEQTKADQHRTQVVSLDKTVGDEEGTTIAELVPAPENGFSEVLDKIQGEQLKAVIWPIVDALPGKQGPVIRMRYENGYTLRQIGETLGTTPESVRQTENKALRELRQPSRRRYLLPFFADDDRIRNSAMQGTGVNTFNYTWTSSTERVALDAW